MAQKVLARRPELRDIEVFRESDTGLTSRQVLEQHIEWRPFVDAKLMDEKDLGLLRDYQQPDDQAILLQERGTDLAKLFIKLMLNVSQEPVQQYILALVDQLLSEDESRRVYFHRLPREYNPFKPFLSILNLSANHTYHPFTIAKTTRVLASLLNGGVAPDSAELREFLQYLITRMDSAKGAELISAVSAAKILLRNHEVQGVFVREGGLKPLVNLLRKDTQNTQLVYIAAFTLWLFTFNQDIVAELHDNGVVAKLSDVLKNVVKEKVVRVTLAALRNLLDKQGLNEQMISHGVHKTIPSLMQRKWNDDDLESDLKVVDEKLQGAIQGLSSFERYKAEIESGVVEWTPVHNEKFWRENVSKFDEHNGQLVKSLVNLLDSEDEVTLEVACFDLGEFARWHPDGKKIVAKLGGKTKLMKHMMSKFPKVSKQALLAVQKIMVQNWESLNSASTASAGGAPTL